MMHPILRVQKSDAVAPEQLGSKYKFWFNEGKRRLLFKAEERGTGEDWAEKIADELCNRLGLPHVHYELADLFDGDKYIQPGVICESCADAHTKLVLGNELLLSVDDSYPQGAPRKYKVRQHTVDAVLDVFRIRGLDRPPEIYLASLPEGISSALDMFIGYVMLDAWIANQDRHHENWGALMLQAGAEGKATLCLAPTFDHGAGLARNLRDSEREERLSSKDKNRSIRFFAARARSAFYDSATDGQPLGTVEAFFRFAESSAAAASIWLKRMSAIDSTAIQHILEEIPDSRMSGISRQFTLELLLVNQGRLLEEWNRR